MKINATKVQRYEHTFTVEGVTRFPIDMLRYDTCMPATGRDSNTCYRAVMGEVRTTPLRITLRRFAGAKDIGPTVERWASFGWTVVEEG